MVKNQMRHYFSSKRFVVQLMVIFLFITLGTVLGLGIPVGWLLDKQTTQQLHALIDQSNQTTSALIENKFVQLQNLALLMVERPTLNQLMIEGGYEEDLSAYLEGFLENAIADTLAVCQNRTTLAATGINQRVSICESSSFEGFSLIGDQVWMLSSATLSETESSETLIVVGQQANSILKEFHTQSSLEYFLFENSTPIASNLDNNDSIRFSNITPDLRQYTTIFVNEKGSDVAYMSTLIPLPGNQNLSLIGLLKTESYSALNLQLRNIIIGTISAICLLGVAIALLISRRISKPINQLAVAAAALREGDLTTPLTTSSKIWEIAQLTNALEDARVSLRHSLNQLQNEKAWIEDLLDSIVEGILTVDDNARITFASESISHIIGVDPTVIIGRPIDRYFVSSSNEELFSHQIPDLNQSRRIPIQLEDKEILLSVSTSEFVPPEAGNATRALVIRDVTDEERIYKQMGEFMANITHEFRTPLTALSASVELLIDQLPDLSTKEIEHLLNALNIGIVNLQALIDNLIEAASIEAGRFKVYPKPIELSAIIKDAIDTIQPIAKKLEVQMVPPKQKPAFLVMADRRRTTQALLNLLSNAVKHSPKNGSITIRTLILEKTVMVEVHDEGTGIAPDFQAHLFNRFVTPETEEVTKNLGLGLGLSVVKAVIEAQHGEVGFRNKEKHGALFWFTLPLIEGSN